MLKLWIKYLINRLHCWKSGHLFDENWTAVWVKGKFIGYENVCQHCGDEFWDLDKEEPYRLVGEWKI